MTPQRLLRTIALLLIPGLMMDATVWAALPAAKPAAVLPALESARLDSEALASPAYPFIQRIDGLTVSLMYRLQGHPLVDQLFQEPKVVADYFQVPPGTFWRNHPEIVDIAPEIKDSTAVRHAHVSPSSFWREAVMSPNGQWLAVIARNRKKSMVNTCQVILYRRSKAGNSFMEQCVNTFLPLINESHGFTETTTEYPYHLVLSDDGKLHFLVISTTRVDYHRGHGKAPVLDLFSMQTLDLLSMFEGQYDSWHRITLTSQIGVKPFPFHYRISEDGRYVVAASHEVCKRIPIESLLNGNEQWEDPVPHEGADLRVRSIASWLRRGRVSAVVSRAQPGLTLVPDHTRTQFQAQDIEGIIPPLILSLINKLAESAPVVMPEKMDIQFAPTNLFTTRTIGIGEELRYDTNLQLGRESARPAITLDVGMAWRWQGRAHFGHEPLDIENVYTLFHEVSHTLLEHDGDDERRTIGWALALTMAAVAAGPVLWQKINWTTLTIDRAVYNRVLETLSSSQEKSTQSVAAHLLSEVWASDPAPTNLADLAHFLSMWIRDPAIQNEKSAVELARLLKVSPDRVNEAISDMISSTPPVVLRIGA